MAKPTITNMAVLRLRERLARRALFKIRHRQGAQLLPKGSIVVKKATATGSGTRIQGANARSVVRTDRDPARAHVGQEFGRHPHGVDALDLCYTKSHVDVQVVSGDSAAVSKLRENNRSDRGGREEFDVRPDRQLRRFIYYDLVRRKNSAAADAGLAKSGGKFGAAACQRLRWRIRSNRRRSASSGQVGRREKQEAFDHVLATIEALAKNGNR
jgi:hypothetical protein